MPLADCPACAPPYRRRERDSMRRVSCGARRRDDLSLQAPDACRWRALRGRTPVGAPWNLALVVAAGAAALAGHLLAGGRSPLVGLVAVLVGALTAPALSQLPRCRTWSGVGAATLLAVLALAAGVDRALVAALPLLVVVVAHACFVRQCADEIGRPLHRLQRLR